MDKLDKISKPLINVTYKKIAPQLQKLTEVWSDLGISEDEQTADATEFAETIEHILSRLLANKLEEVTDKRRALLEEAESHGLHLIELSRMLDIPNIEPDENLKIIPLRDYLKNRVLELETIRNERATKLEELRCQEKKLAGFLGELPLKIQPNVLTTKTLDDVKGNIDKLENEKLKRKELFLSMRKKVLLLMEVLEHTANTTLETDIVSGKDEAFFLTEVNMNAVKALLEKFQREIRLNEDESKTLTDNIKSLWNFLEVDTDFQERFLSQHVGHRPSTVQALREEFKRCKDIKMKHACQYVTKVRSEISHMWNICYFNRSQRSIFTPFASVDFTEELVDIHDSELQKLKNIREEGEEIFAKFEMRARLWNRMQQLDSTANNPTRLVNRGGQLLKEEKERKRLQVLIPKLETDLEAVVSKWESEKGRKFLLSGMQIMEFIKNQWDVYQEEKENEKLARQAAKGKNLEDNLSCTNKISRKRLLATPTKESHTKLAKLTPLVRNERKPAISSGKVGSRNMTRIARKQTTMRRKEADSRTQPLRVIAGASNSIFGFQESRLIPSFPSTSQLSTYSEFENNILPRSEVGLSSTMTTPCSSSP